MEQIQAQEQAAVVVNETVVALRGTEILSMFVSNGKGFYSIPEAFDAAAANDIANRALTIGNRSWLETDPAFKQIIPYVIFTREEEDEQGNTVTKYLVYQRCKGSGEERLLKAFSIGFGGHTSIGDVFGLVAETRNFTIPDLLQRSAIRELSEEVTIENIQRHISIIPFGLLYNEETLVNSVHIGVAAVIQVGKELIITSNEKSAVIAGWYTAEEISHLVNVEQWTKDVLSAEEHIGKAVATVKEVEARLLAEQEEAMKQHEEAAKQHSYQVDQELAKDAANDPQVESSAAELSATDPATDVEVTVTDTNS